MEAIAVLAGACDRLYVHQNEANDKMLSDYVIVINNEACMLELYRKRKKERRSRQIPSAPLRSVRYPALPDGAIEELYNDFAIVRCEKAEFSFFRQTLFQETDDEGVLIKRGRTYTLEKTSRRTRVLLRVLFGATLALFIPILVALAIIISYFVA